MIIGVSILMGITLWMLIQHRLMKYDRMEICILLVVILRFMSLRADLKKMNFQLPESSVEWRR
ncbi:hypothetical protein DNK59_11255 [Pseudomonas sp. TKO26]|nr:hypothetical protein DNK62_11255 [Pseudomonas sp. TKO30]PYY89965.1 hypothetical protein DNK61_11250 [Pseudomonas sp. TKO29]PYY93052.1 hypothetical protein DNK59_11255 [Pseudomonas sp. TKO26]PYZ00182.1 hypothetical protein DNK60_11250 [Pseudomonas sp. TKO14]